MNFLRIAATLGCLLCVACSDSGKSNPSSSVVNDADKSNIVYSYVKVKNYNSGPYAIDTFTIASKYFNCDIQDSNFECRYIDFCHEKRNEKFPVDADTVRLNYGENRVSNFSFEVEVPKIDMVALRKFFAELRLPPCAVLKDSVFSNYSFEAKGLPENISLMSEKIEGFDWISKHTMDSINASSENSVALIRADRCAEERFPPDSIKLFAKCEARSSCKMPVVYTASVKENPPKVCYTKIDKKTGIEEDVGTVDGSLKMTKDVLMERYYTLVNTRLEPFVSDTTVDWTLIYVDQYGRKDSLAMKTVFKK